MPDIGSQRDSCHKLICRASCFQLPAPTDNHHNQPGKGAETMFLFNFCSSPALIEMNTYSVGSACARARYHCTSGMLLQLTCFKRFCVFVVLKKLPEKCRLVPRWDPGFDSWPSLVLKMIIRPGPVSKWPLELSQWSKKATIKTSLCWKCLLAPFQLGI